MPPTWSFWTAGTEPFPEGTGGVFVDGARLALNDGSIFGKEGEGFMRLNAGCPRSILERALSQLEEAYENRGFRQQQSQN